MIAKEEIREVIFTAIDEVNALLPKDRRLKKSADLILSGDAGGLDSLGLINLVVSTEQKFQERFGFPITLADERAMAESNNPLKSVETLIDYISYLANEKANG